MRAETAGPVSGRTFPSPRNILVIQLGDIGDVVLATPTLRALKESWPGARLSVLVRKPYGSLLSADPVLHEVIESGKGRGKFAERGGENLRLVRRLRGARYDLVIDLRTGDRGAVMAWLTGAPVRIVRRDPQAPFWHDRLAFTHPVAPVPAGRPVHPGGDQSLRIVRAVGVDTADSAPRLHVAPGADIRIRELLAEIGMADSDRWITVNPFSRWKYKEWAYGKWCTVIDGLWEAHRLPALVVGSREDADAAGEIVRDRDGRAWALAGRTTLGELAALLRRSTLHLGVDSAAPHIAAAVGTPTATIFGPSDWRAWTVADDRHRIVTPDMECVPCHRKGCDGTGESLCLKGLGPESVILAAEDILAARTRPARGAHAIMRRFASPETDTSFSRSDVRLNRYRILDWDTAFFGIVTARILPDRLSTRDLGETLSRMKRDKVRLAYWASDPDDEESQRAAQSCRGFLADRKVTYVADLDRAPAPPERLDWIPEEYSGAVPDADLEELAVQAGLHSRFRIDPNMPEGKFDALYRQWIRNSVNRQFADAVLVIRRPGGIIGMVTVGEADGCGFIGLIAVDAAARGKNAGVALVRAALDWTRRKGLSSAKVVTQGTNLAACRLYEKCGYRVGKVENVYHFWL